MKISQLVLGGAFLIVAGMALSGCNYIQERITQTVTDQVAEQVSGGQFDIDSSDNEYTITTEDGTVNVGGSDISGLTAVVQIPEWLVADETGGVMTSESQGKKSVYGALVSQRSLDETYSHFETYFADQGYENITKADYSGSKMITGTKGPEAESTLAVSVSPGTGEDANKVQVVVIYSGPATE